MRRRLALPLSLAALLVGAALPGLAAAPPKEDAKAAKSPQATVYLAWVKAVKAGDLEGWKKVVPAEAHKQIEEQAKEMGKKPKDILELLGALSPDKNTITGLKVEGTKATLSVVGTSKDAPEPTYGSVEMVQEGGAWKVGKQAWGDKPK